MKYKIKGEKYGTNIKLLTRILEMENERYQRDSDYSVTDFVNPPRIVHLKKRHRSELIPDPENSLGAVLGSALHEYLDNYLCKWIDKYNYEGCETERRITSIVTGLKGGVGGEFVERSVSGQFDALEDDELTDWKSGKVWKLIYDPDLIDYHEQMNLYSFLLHTQGVEVKKLNLVMFYKDWVESMALRDRTYPQHPVIEYELTHWGRKAQQDLLNERLQKMIDTEDLSDEELPICTREERWERHQDGSDIHYAILKTRTAQRATKLIKGGTLDQAVAVANGLPKMTSDSVIEIRYAQPKRCIKYCDVNSVCNWYQKWVKLNERNAVNDYVSFK